MGVNNLPKTVTRQRRDCDLNPGPSAPESSTLTTRLPSHPTTGVTIENFNTGFTFQKLTVKSYTRLTALFLYYLGKPIPER